MYNIIKKQKEKIEAKRCKQRNKVTEKKDYLPYSSAKTKIPKIIYITTK